MPERHTIDVDGFAHGGEAVGRLPNGKACFVAYAIPGERVVVEIVEERARWARARLLEVVEASPDRVDPPCPYYGPERAGGPPRCGGCVLQHVAPPRQAELKRRVVVEQLRRIAGIHDPPVADTVSVAAHGYRDHARFAVDPSGRLGFRRLRSRAVVPVERCLLLSERAQRVRSAAGEAWRGAEEVTVRAGDRGAALVVRPRQGGRAPQGDPPTPSAGGSPVAVVDLSRAVVAAAGPATVIQVGEFSYQVSPTSFFQPGAQGAATLVGCVRAAVDANAGESLLDLYCGVGLFSVPLAADGAEVTAVEADPVAAADARVNLAGHPGAEILRDRADDAVEAFVAAGRDFAVVVLDPPRRGAGERLCRALPALRPRLVVYVSCDPATFARDARTLGEAGLALSRAVPVDQFAQTAAVEIVATFAPR